MNILTVSILILSSLAAVVSLGMAGMLFIRLRWPAPMGWFVKMYASALSPIFALAGLLVGMAGIFLDALWLSLSGTLITTFFFLHIFMVTRAPKVSTGFESAFGFIWMDEIPQAVRDHFLSARFSLQPLYRKSESVLQANLPFATIPGTDRQLLCDIWQPSKSATKSGLAFIYLHGGAWYMLDKDLGTRPFFNHLTSQGHVVMDVAYRLSPETDLMGMTHDAKRAIVWMKEHAYEYGVDPNRIVIGGGSSGAHLALLAAFTAGDPDFEPSDLKRNDTHVCAVVSFYGPADLKAMYYHLNQHLTTRSTPGHPQKPVPTSIPSWIIKKMGNNYHRLGFDKGFANAGAFAPMLGGHPDECPAVYDLFSPIAHVHRDCPPTLLIHGEHDVMAPVQATKALYSQLVKNRVPTVLHVIPQTEHAFDLQLPKLSPSARNAIYDVERFLGLMSVRQLKNVAPSELSLVE